MLTLLGYRLAAWIARAVPRAAADSIAIVLARAAFWMNVPARATAERNQRRLSPGDACGASGRARESFEHFAIAFADFLRLDSLDPAALASAVEIRGREHLERAREAGQGVIVLSAHLGNWEWGAARLASLGGRVHIVAGSHSSGAVDAFFDSRRLRWGVERLAGEGLWPRASAALRRGEWLAVMGDRPALRRSRSACAWAASLARRTGAALLPAVIVRTGPGRYAACFEPALSPEQAGQGGFAAILRRYVARYPGQWCAFGPLPEGLGG